MINIHNLQCILAIARYNSLSEAARELYLSQPYLSRILAETEKEYAVTIFRRNKKGLMLTESGITFLTMARETINGVHEYEERLHASDAHCILRIAACSSSHIADAYLDFIAKHRESYFRAYYHEMDWVSVIDQIHLGHADIGFIILDEINSPMAKKMIISRNLEMMKIADLSLRLVTRLDHPLTKLKRGIWLADLYKYPFILYSKINQEKTDYQWQSNYEMMLNAINWSRITKITYVNSRAMYLDLIKFTDAISLGFPLTDKQKKNREMASLSFDIKRPIESSENPNSVLYAIFTEGEKKNEAVQEILEIIKDFHY